MWNASEITFSETHSSRYTYNTFYILCRTYYSVYSIICITYVYYYDHSAQRRRRQSICWITARKYTIYSLQALLPTPLSPKTKAQRILWASNEYTVHIYMYTSMCAVRTHNIAYASIYYVYVLYIYITYYIL